MEEGWLWMDGGCELKEETGRMCMDGCRSEVEGMMRMRDRIGLNEKNYPRPVVINTILDGNIQTGYDTIWAVGSREPQPKMHENRESKEPKRPIFGSIVSFPLQSMSWVQLSGVCVPWPEHIWRPDWREVKFPNEWDQYGPNAGMCTSCEQQLHPGR